MTHNDRKASTGRPLLAGGAVLALAAVAVVGFVLPAEYGIDPTGIGKATGLIKMAQGGQENIYLQRGQARKGVMFPLPGPVKADQLTALLDTALHDNGQPPIDPAALKSDRFMLELQPFEGIELKYELAQGTPLIFSWTGTGPLDIDMHAHPYAGGTAATESYVIAKMPGQQAVYIAPFTGIHGWYWQNRTMQPVKLTLDAAGAIVKSFTFDQAGQHERPLDPPVAGGAGAASS
ncbi:MAG: hypothetical protein RLZZ08_1155 [Pseudomonadota bacterium]|jgi:hypothetical protein